MDTTLSEFKYAQTFLNDVIIGGKEIRECYSNTCVVLEKSRKLNIKVKLAKYQFFSTEVEFLGNISSSEGVIPTFKHQEAIVKCRAPQNLSQLK